MKLEMDAFTEELHAKIHAHDEHEIETVPTGNGAAQTICKTCDVVLLDNLRGVSDWTLEHGGREIAVDYYVIMTASVNLDTGRVKYIGVACEDAFSVLPDGGCVHYAEGPDTENVDDLAAASLVLYRELDADRAPDIQLWR